MRDRLLVSAILLSACVSFTILPGLSAGPVAADYLIVGAGVSGLSAGKYFKDNAGGKKVIILEAQGHTGGRILTHTFGSGTKVDLGAGWIHGITNNPIYDICTANNIQTRTTNYDDDSVFAADGTELTDSQQTAVATNFQNFMSYFNTQRKSATTTSTLQSYVDAFKNTLTAERKTWLSFSVNTVIEHEYSDDAGLLSAQYFDNAQEPKGADVMFPQGYAQVTDALKAGLDIRLNSEVSKIDYSGSNVLVTLKDGTTQYSASRVIVTLPLGVLKQGGVTFTPALPQRKLQAISALGMGTLNKVVMEFPSAFWNNYQVLNRIPPDGEHGQWAETYNVKKIMGGASAPNVLVAFNAGSYGWSMEGLTDAQVKNRVMAVLSAQYGSSIPDPIYFNVTRWRSNPFSYGSYSYIAAGATPDDQKALGDPVNKLVYFAGEATSVEDTGTVHGAYATGIVAAKAVLTDAGLPLAASKTTPCQATLMAALAGIAALLLLLV